MSKKEVSLDESAFNKDSVKENRAIKDSVFVDLFFSDETATQNLISLYNALHPESRLPAGTKVKKFRLEQVLYMNFQNDITANFEDKLLIFGEHQSTINENMPVRSLMYAGRTYEKIIPIRMRYKKEQIMLPKPEFYTFYNGTEDWITDGELKLSDAFMNLDAKENPALELIVRVININTDKGSEVLKKCPVLYDYSRFIETVRKYDINDTEKLRKAINECKAKGILKEYLERKESEVINMLTAEYSYEEDIAVQREESFQQGERKGRQEGRQEGFDLLAKIMQTIKSGITEDSDIAKSCQCSVEEVNTIRKIVGI